MKTLVYSKSSKIIIFARILLGFLGIFSIFAYFLDPHFKDIRVLGMPFINFFFYGNSFFTDGSKILIRQGFFVLHEFNKNDVISIHIEYVKTSSWTPPYVIKYKKNTIDGKIVKTVSLVPFFFSNTNEFIETIKQDL